MSTFERIDLSKFDGHTPGPWMVRFNGTIERRTVVKRLDGGITRILASCGPIDAELIAAAPDLLAALRAAYAENDRLQSQLIAVQEEAMTIYSDNDRLRASALNWVTVTDDLATLPDQDSERDVLVDTVRWDDGEPSEMRTYYVLHLETDSADNLTPGDRWSYIPQPKEVDNG